MGWRAALKWKIGGDARVEEGSFRMRCGAADGIGFKTYPEDFSRNSLRAKARSATEALIAALKALRPPESGHASQKPDHIEPDLTKQDLKEPALSIRI
jgi:hypothetical protein